MTSIFSRRTFLLVLPAGLACASSASAGLFSPKHPDDLDLSLARLSQGGRYRVELTTGSVPITTGRMLSWTAKLRSSTGQPVSEARITVDGGMPQHGHGLPTAPRVTQTLGGGAYLIEGIRFNMHGWWTFELDIEAANGADAVTFNLVL